MSLIRRAILKTKTIIMFFIFIFINLFNFCGFLKFYENYAKAENNNNEDTMKSEDWKMITQENKNEQDDDFKYIQKTNPSKDESPNDINFYYFIGLMLLIIGIFGTICSLCSIFRIKKLGSLIKKDKNT